VLKNKKKVDAGFTLIEIAVVLVIVSLLLGSFITSLSSRIETTRRNDTIKQLEDIKSALLGFVSAQGRLPCPATAVGQGLEQPVGGGACTAQHGFVPGVTLGLNGSYNRDLLLTDSWGNPFRYSVTVTDVNAFTTPVGIKNATMATLESPASLDLVICNGSSIVPNSCTGGGVTALANSVPFVIMSLGQDGNFSAGAVSPATSQGENSGEALVAANAAGENIAYTVGGNRVFAKMSYSSTGSVAGAFDDMLLWVSSYEIYSRMIEAGQLP
jgi:prepilin-type N-terminal cleavage/methylation domain-containing protein